MPNVDIDDKLYSACKEITEKFPVTFPTIKHFVNNAVKDKLNKPYPNTQDVKQRLKRDKRRKEL